MGKNSLFTICPSKSIGSPSSPHIPLSLQNRSSRTCRNACPCRQMMCLRYTWLHLPQSFLGERGLSMCPSYTLIRCRSKHFGILRKILISAVQTAVFIKQTSPDIATQAAATHAGVRCRGRAAGAPRGARAAAALPAPGAPAPLADAGWRPRYEQLPRGEQVGGGCPEGSVSLPPCPYS